MKINEYKTPLEQLLEAIDYSFLKTDGTYDEALTYHVIDKVKYIKGLIDESSRKKMEQAVADAQYKEEFPFTFDELKDNDVKVGDIVAAKFSSTSKNVNYFLLRKGFPEDFNTSLCCDSIGDGQHLYQIGFHWQGFNPYRFRKTTDEEREAFIDACVKTLHEPMHRNDKGEIVFGWDEDMYAQILGNMVRDGLISMYKGEKLSKELKKIHNVDFLKLYKRNYGFIR